ncbi:DNA topoisomerase I [Nanoarchaeota archaeon]
MPYELIITEKPNAAKKIADALASGKAIKKGEKGVPYYEITHGNRDIIVGCAVGHLFTVAEKDKKKGWSYPIFDIMWVPNSEKKAAFTKKYANVLKKLAKGADEFTVATDYDIEGEVIGWNVVRFLCGKETAHRMKFSTLTKDDLTKAYEGKSEELDWGQAFAGETRHFLDWMYGINLSRALTLSIKSTGAFRVMSSGRVQGPALKIIVDREREIKAFIPVPFWQITLEGEAQKKIINAMHETEKFWKKDEAAKIYEKVQGKDAKVKDIDKKKFNQKPPYPFDLTSLQIEAYRVFGIAPKGTLAAAQSLYTDGYISYPRTSSQKLPKELGLNKIMQQLAKSDKFSVIASKVLAGKMIPNEGKKTDPAHPAIYPTGQVPKSLDSDEEKIFDLIVKRFVATFGEEAVRETAKLIIDVNDENFISKGTITLIKGWHDLYSPYATFKEEELPNVSKGEEIKVKKTEMLDKETAPPKRFTQASIIKELEKRGLGTKSTRAAIVDALYHRGYVNERSIEATELGIRVVGTLEKYAPEILDEKLTRDIELKMEEIREGKKEEEEVLDEAKVILTKTLEKFKKNEKVIGEELYKATIETRNELSFVGKCNKCKEGDLQIRRGKYGMFIACDKYPACDNTFKLPSNALVVPARKECDTCGFPKVKIIKARRRPQEMCINEDCPTKKELEKEVPALPESKMTCPSCGGKFVLKQSFYGKFYGCENYPKCRFMMKLDGTVREGKAPTKKKTAKKKTTKKVTKKKTTKKK